MIVVASLYEIMSTPKFDKLSPNNLVKIDIMIHYIYQRIIITNMIGNVNNSAVIVKRTVNFPRCLFQ